MSKTMSISTDPIQEARETLRRNRTIAISLFTGFIFLAMLVIFTPSLLNSSTPNYGGFALTIPVILIGLICALLAWQNRVTLAANILFGTVLILSLGTPIVGKGQGVSVGFLVAFIGIGIATSSFPEKSVNRGVWLSVITGVAVMLLDQVLPDFGLESNNLYTNITATILSIIFLAVSARRFNSLPLRIKLIISFSFVTILPLLILGIYNNFNARNNLANGTREQITNISSLAAQQYDDFFEEQLNQIATDAKQVALVDYLSLSAF